MPSCKSFAVLVVDSATCALLAGSDSENWVGVAVMAVVPVQANSTLPSQLDHHCHCSPNQHVQSCSVRTWTLLPRFPSMQFAGCAAAIPPPVVLAAASSKYDLFSSTFELPFEFF